jgi:probable F420-dependent oxidoreductase
LEFVVATAFSDPTHYCELARAAEAAGFAALAVSDHVVHPEKIASRYPYTEDGSPRFRPDTPWPDPWVAIGAMAAVTQRLRFLTNIYVLPLRNPFLVAKAVGTAAVLSGDRVALGVGVGWMQDEFVLLEQEFQGRGARCDEMIEVLRKLWTGAMVEHHGRFYDFGRLQMTPAPRQRIPLYVGGTSDAALRRAARLGDGWISELHPLAELRSLVARLHALRAECGRDRDPFHVFGAATDAFGLDGYRRLAEAGVTHVLTLPWMFYAGNTTSLDGKRDGIRRFGDEIIGRLGGEGAHLPAEGAAAAPGDREE